MTTSAEDLARFASALFDGWILRPADTQGSASTPVVRTLSLHQFALRGG